jgi:predicted anti-sigma-YlaC factor YlaD
MRCEHCRDGVSARLDGEDPGVGAELLDAHLAGCAACRAYAQGAEAMSRSVRVSAVDEVPDLTAPILVAIGEETRDRGADRFDVRVALALLGALKLAFALPWVLSGSGADGSVHVVRELGSFDVALAVGLLVVAWRPSRAAGIFPVLAALSACLVLTALVDVSEGQGSTGRELTHSAELLGMVLVWILVRAQRPARRDPVAA